MFEQAPDKAIIRFFDVEIESSTIDDGLNLQDFDIGFASTPIRYLGGATFVTERLYRDDLRSFDGEASIIEQRSYRRRNIRRHSVSPNVPPRPRMAKKPTPLLGIEVLPKRLHMRTKTVKNGAPIGTGALGRFGAGSQPSPSGRDRFSEGYIAAIDIGRFNAPVNLRQQSAPGDRGHRPSIARREQ